MVSTKFSYFLDIDECKNSETCEEVCVNYPGDYTCACREGRSLMADEKHCEGKIIIH